ncbi:cell division control 14, SIN component [Eremomyces bilateralis CBS 781.70]|uniref:Cell division control 14, SIN component n=1 Tax=Eremomyces bilateralis CBS 781.70 TaxID=1392243 RepID=A0A6G1G9Y5_9PEZI|nr:cell division control 14, SIN component [Eremomyces bilateralis CBS 781.70]KAF1814888.1 cell division control 14, SIN component [Eremomyces bilateralis CBS 781.70]
MEALLSTAFNYISSKDAQKISKGLRQIKGFLEQICLSPSSSSSPSKRPTVPTSSDAPSHEKSLVSLGGDPAFRAFFRLQERFEWNVATRLVACLERLLGMGTSAETDLLILSSLTLLQGCLLLHPPSRSIFEEEIYLNLLLDLLDPLNPASTQSTTLQVLMSALLYSPRAARSFERTDGLATAASLYKSRSTSPHVRKCVAEFLYFYLLDEINPTTNPESSDEHSNPSAVKAAQSAPGTGAHAHRRGAGRDKGNDVEAPQQRWSMALGDASALEEELTRHREREVKKGAVRGRDEKQRLLARHLGSVESLEKELRQRKPFAEMMGYG